MTIRAAFPSWPDHNRRLRDRVAATTEAELAIRPGPDRWPIWATIGHLACQRVFWLYDVWHISEVNDALSAAGIEPIDFRE